MDNSPTRSFFKDGQIFRRYFIAGLLVWVPLWVTLLVLRFLVNIFDSTMLLIPDAYQPDALLGHHFPGLGIVISLLVVFFTGMLVTNFLGKKLLLLGEFFLSRIPLVRTIYSAAKQVMETVFSSSGQSFKKAYLVEFPRQGMWTVAFQTGNAGEEIENLTGIKMLTLYVPTTPIPSSGFMIMVPPESAIELRMSIDQALKLVISLGVVNPITPETTRLKS